jgi:hypothetical protein
MYFKKSDTQIYEKYREIFSEPLKNLTEQVGPQGSVDNKKTKMDNETFEKFHLRISRCKNYLNIHHPWFGIFLGKLKTVPTYSVDTMGVDNYGNIYINPDWTLAKTEGETIGVLAHEVMHIITLTFFRLGARDMQLWNIATDYIMNKELLESDFALPAEGCLPKKVMDKWIVDLKDDKTGISYGEIDVTNKSEEAFYDEFVKLIQKEQKKNPKGGDGKGDPQDPRKKVFHVGDRAKSRSTGLKGTITAVKGLTPGKQTLTIKWD